MKGDTDLDLRFDYHPPRSELITGEFVRLRMHIKALAIHLDEVLPTGREASLAMTKLEETHMWVNAAIARHQDEVEKRVVSGTEGVPEGEGA
jgi:queuine/archaeosine tRNA-ribosyltransferase